MPVVRYGYPNVRMEGEPASMSATMTRLTEPMVREHGELRTATWDEALDRAAEGLRRAMDRNPGWGAGVFSCSKATNEMNFVAQELARQVLRTNNIVSCTGTCHAPSVAVLATVFGAGGGTSS